MSDHFDNSVKSNNKGVEKTVTCLKAKFQQEIPKQAATERDFLTFIQEPKDQIAQEEIEIQKVVASVALEKKTEMEKIKEPGKLRKPGRRKPLTRDQIIHLHQALGHIHPDKIKDMVKKTKMWDDNTLKAIDDLNRCEVCAVEHYRLPRPKIAAPRAISHNHILAIDLKENRRYKNAPPFILYFCDVFQQIQSGLLH